MNLAWKFRRNKQIYNVTQIVTMKPVRKQLEPLNDYLARLVLFVIAAASEHWLEALVHLGRDIGERFEQAGAAQRANLSDRPWSWHDIVAYPTII
jgi:hypothetical protein